MLHNYIMGKMLQSWLTVKALLIFMFIIFQNGIVSHAVAANEKVFGGEFSYGIIMGYYGDLWPDEVYRDYADYAAKYGHKFFVYAPKEDLKLRDDWRTPFSAEEVANLKKNRDAFEAKGIAFGIGLSPYNLNTLNDQDKADLTVKINQINEINPSILGIFFDDIQKTAIIPTLGAIQVDIAEFSASVSSANEFISVPTYYSDDLILQRVLGPAPESYFADFGKLNDKFSIMWTGSQILSTGFTADGLNRVAKMMNREKIVIWDNYPVNDPKYLNDHLRLYALTGRTKELSTLTAGFAMNPMSQPYASMIPMSTAKDLFENSSYNPEESFLKNLNELCGPDLAKDISENLNYFVIEGIQSTESSNIQRMYALFSKYTDPQQQKFTAEILKLLDEHGRTGYRQ